jgi:hypothetical protein
LPCELPADRTESLTQSLRRDPHVLKLEQEVQRLELAQAGQATLGEAKRRVSRYRSSLKQKALLAYQEEWVRLRKESKILNQGKQPVTDISGQDQLQSLCLLRPERRRLATWLASDAPLITDRDVAGNERFTLFVGSKRPRSPISQAVNPSRAPVPVRAEAPRSPYQPHNEEGDHHGEALLHMS